MMTGNVCISLNNSFAVKYWISRISVVVVMFEKCLRVAANKYPTCKLSFRIIFCVV